MHLAQLLLKRTPVSSKRIYLAKIQRRAVSNKQSCCRSQIFTDQKFSLTEIEYRDCHSVLLSSFRHCRVAVLKRNLLNLIKNRNEITKLIF